MPSPEELARLLDTEQPIQSIAAPGSDSDAGLVMSEYEATLAELVAILGPAL